MSSTKNAIIDLNKLIKRLPVSKIDFNNLISESLKFPEDKPISDWMQESIYLAPKVSSNPGFFDISLTPYLKEIFDAFANDDVRIITIKKPTQTGLTLSILMLMGYILDQRPANSLVVSPTRKMAEELSTERFLQILKDSPVLAKYITKNAKDITKLTYKFKSCNFHFTWASSATELASKAKKYLFMDEIDKYAEEIKNEADPISLAMERLKTYPDSKVVFASTPTTSFNNISKKFYESNQMYYHCMCPKCEQYQELDFYQIKKPKEEMLDIDIKNNQPCWYECIYCQHHIVESEKFNFINTGKWVAKQPEITHHKGFHITGIMSPFMSFSDILFEFLDAKHSGDMSKMKNFTNSIIGEYFEEGIEKVEVGEDCIDFDLKRNYVNDDCAFLLAGIDVQENRFYYTIYSFNFNNRINLIDYGVAQSTEEVEDRVLNRVFITPTNRAKKLNKAAIDSRYKTQEIYKLCEKYKNLLIPIKGDKYYNENIHYKFLPAYRDDRGKGIPGMLDYALLQTVYYKDMLFHNLFAKNVIKFHEETTIDFINHLNSEHKTLSKKGQRYEYKLKKNQKRNDFLDCTVYCIWLSDYIGYQYADIFKKSKDEVIKEHNKEKEIINNLPIDKKNELKEMLKFINSTKHRNSNVPNDWI